jgi:hypothetical protein
MALPATTAAMADPPPGLSPLPSQRSEATVSAHEIPQKTPMTLPAAGSGAWPGSAGL